MSSKMSLSPPRGRQATMDISEDIMNFTFGRGDTTTMGNAMTFRSFVDPQEKRPDLQLYMQPAGVASDEEVASTGLDLGRDLGRATFNQLDDEDFKFSSQVGALEIADNNNNNHAPEVVDGGNDAAAAAAAAATKPDAAPEQAKFGTWDGVFVSCILNIFGVIMFLRLGWVVGQTGWPLAIVIILMATVVTTTTTLSMSAISTNGRIRAGGAYYLISRSIGPKIGGAIGCMLTLGLATAVSLYVIGFCETLVEQLFDTFTLTGDELNDIRIYGLILVAIIFCMVWIGVDWVIKLQFFFFALICVSIASFFIGTFSHTDKANGFTGYRGDNIADNSSPDYHKDAGVEYDFFKVFAVFFPAVTGIMAGANISGDLKDPSTAIPAGTLWAVGVSTIVYSLMAFCCGAVAQRQLGNDENIGLLWDTLIMVKISIWGPLVLAGIYAATFTSALASLVGAPRILQRIAADGIIPVLNPFVVVRARDNSPLRGLIVCTVVACAGVLVGELNLIAPLITMFFLMTYGLINFACFSLEVSKSPGWRPTFKHFTWWLSLFGALVCLVIMFLTDVLMAIIAIVFGACVYKYIETKNVYVNWGSAAEARQDLEGVRLLMDLRNVKQHIKTFRPHFLVLTGDPSTRLSLVRMAVTMNGGHGALVYGQVVKGSMDEFVAASDKRQEHLVGRLNDGYWVHEEIDCAGFLDTVIAPNLLAGAQSLYQLGGLGRLRPNTVLIGWKDDWATASSDEVNEYVQTIRWAFLFRMGAVVSRGHKQVDWDAVTNPHGCIDVWWLVDDGGLTILLSYLLTLNTYWRRHTGGGRNRCSVRLIMVVKGGRDFARLYKVVADMIRSFRMDWEVVVEKAGKQATSAETAQRFEELSGCSIDDTGRPVVTQRWLRVGEIMKKTSKDAKLVICTLPFPRLYDQPRHWMALLDVVTESITAPVLFMRGNQQNVLTLESE